MARTEKKSVKNNPVNRDIIVMIILAASVLMFFSVLGFCGIVGRVLRIVLFGTLGMTAYAFPVILFFSFAYAMVNRDDLLFKRKAVGLIGLFVFSCAFFQIVMIGYDSSYRIFSYFTYSSADHLGGGLLGGLITHVLCRFLGMVGAYIIICVSIIIFSIVLTQKPLISLFRNNTSKAYSKAMETRSIRLENKKIAKEKKSAKKEAGESVLPDLADSAGLTVDSEMKDVSAGFKVSDETEDDSDEDGIKNRLEADADLFKKYIIEKINPRKKNKSNRKNKVSVSLEAGDENRENSELKDELPNHNNEQEENFINGEVSDIQPESAVSAVSPGKNKSYGVKKYRLPPLNLLEKGSKGSLKNQSAQIKDTAKILQNTLHSFGVEARVINASCGPTVTRYELQPEQGVKVSKILSLTDDIKLNLAASDIRIEAPIPGKAAIGIEVPNKTNNAVLLRELLETREFKDSRSKLTIAVGRDLAGKPVISDIAAMPHLLIAGATGSGKSVCINTLIMSLLYKASPDDVRLIMIDPKVVELSNYNGIPHLLCPVVTDPKKAAGTLAWAVSEMTRRYNLFAEYSVRDLNGYNMKAASLAHFAEEDEEIPEILPQIVVVVDELADLMMVAPGEVEDSICRLAQLARAAGIHLIIATQRPSVNVITGVIKANMPSRIALSVTSGIDSRVILDMNGAEKLLGKGDMLFYPAGYPKPARVQGGFVTDEEISKVVNYISSSESDYDKTVQNAIESSVTSFASSPASKDDRDEYFVRAGRFIIEKDKASIGMLQRVFKIGFNRAARIMDQLCDAGVVGEEEGTKPRKIIMNQEQFENYVEENIL